MENIIKNITENPFNEMTRSEQIAYRKKLQVEGKNPPSICPQCNKEKEKNAKLCDTCNKITLRKVIRPSFEELENEIVDNGYVQTGKKYGVTDNSIRKWIQNYVKNEGKQVTKIKIKL